MKQTPNCCICGEPVEEKIHPKTGEVYWNQGENAQPVATGRCCSYCNASVVIPARMNGSNASRILDGHQC